MSTAPETIPDLQLDWSTFLGRAVCPVSPSEFYKLVAGKTILITGAGGSIGSSLARLLMDALPGRLVLLDQSPSGLHALSRAYRERSGDLPEVRFVHGSILESALLEEVFSSFRPEIVFHAAALKHLVPLESDPFAALQTNVFGTAKLLDVSSRYRVKQFVNVSTDKAVNPTSIMGASKRIAELLLLSRNSSFQAHSVRLGNVLGSSGSVVPILMQALQNKSRLELTEPEALRYFVTLEEAAGFLVRSLAFSESSFLLPEMGAPKKLCDLAAFLIHHQPTSDDLPAVYVGLRDGEKRVEELTYDFEYLQSTPVAGIYRICGNTLDAEAFTRKLHRLENIVAERRRTEMLEAVLSLVPNFAPSPTLLRHGG